MRISNREFVRIAEASPTVKEHIIDVIDSLDDKDDKEIARQKLIEITKAIVNELSKTVDDTIEFSERNSSMKKRSQVSAPGPKIDSESLIKRTLGNKLWVQEVLIKLGYAAGVAAIIAGMIVFSYGSQSPVGQDFINLAVKTVANNAYEGLTMVDKMQLAKGMWQLLGIATMYGGAEAINQTMIFNKNKRLT